MIKVVEFLDKNKIESPLTKLLEEGYKVVRADVLGKRIIYILEK